MKPLEKDVYTLEELKGALESQGTTLKPGTILLVRTGWMESYESLSADRGSLAALAPMDKMNSMGIEASREMVAWLWNNRVAAMRTDYPAVEAFPFDFIKSSRCIIARCLCWACRWASCSCSRRLPRIARATGSMNSCSFLRRP